MCVYMSMFIFYSSILKIPPMLCHLKMSLLLLFFASSFCLFCIKIFLDADHFESLY